MQSPPSFYTELFFLKSVETQVRAFAKLRKKYKTCNPKKERRSEMQLFASTAAKYFNEMKEHYVPSAFCNKRVAHGFFKECFSNSQVAHLPCNIAVTIATAAFYRINLYFSSLTPSWPQKCSLFI